jgi:hypothetical protein
MKKSEVINLLLEVLEAVCKVVGKLIVASIEAFPALEKYFLAFLIGAQNLVLKLLPSEI